MAKQINPGTHPDQFYSPTPRQVAHRLVMYQATLHDWPLWLGDVSTAFLHAELDEDDQIIIVEPPETEQKPGQPKIYWRMRKAMYGLRTAPLNFNRFFVKALASKGWERLVAEPQLFQCKRYPGARLSAHVDDVLVTAPTKWMQKIMKEIQEVMTIKWLSDIRGEWVRFLGIEWKRKNGQVLCRVPPKYLGKT